MLYIQVKIARYVKHGDQKRGIISLLKYIIKPKMVS